MATDRLVVGTSSPTTSIYLQADEIAIDVPNNRSLVRAYFRQTTAATSYYNWHDASVSGSTEGTGYGFSGASADFSSGGSGWGTVGPYDVWVTHNSDGTKSTALGLSANYPHASGHGGSASTSLGLSTIPRASTPTFSPNPCDAGTLVTITTNRADSSFTHDLTYSIGAISGAALATGVGASTTWTIPLSLLNQIPNSLTGAITIHTVTKDGSGNVIGSTDTTLTMSVPTSVVPTLTGITNVDSVSAVATAVGKYVQSLSKPTLTIVGAAGAYSSTITGYAVTMGGQSLSGSSASLGTLPAALAVSGGSIPIVATVTDSRGRTASLTVNVVVLAYAPPAITAITGQRALSSGTADDNGTYIRANINAAVSSLINGTEKNDLTYKIWTRDHNVGGAFTLKTTVDTHGITFNSYGLVSPYAVTNSWDVLVEVIDLFSTSAVQFTITTASIFMHWNSSTGVGIGKYREHGMLDVLGKIFHNNGQELGIPATNAEIATGTDNIKVVTPAGLASTVETFTGVVSSSWSNGKPSVTLDAGQTASGSVTPFLPPRGADIQPGDNVILSRIGTLWYIERAYASQPDYMRKVTLTLQNSWYIYSDAMPGDQSQAFGDGSAPQGGTGVTAASTGVVYATKTSTHIVHVEGLLQRASTPAAGSVITQLPVGFRPTRKQLFTVISNGNAWGTVEVTPDGNIRFIGVSSSTGFFSLNNIRFRASTSPYTFVPFVFTGFPWAEATAQLYAGEPATYYGSAGVATPGYTMDEEGVVLFEGVVTPTSNQAANSNITQLTVFPALLTTHNQQWASARQTFTRYGASAGAAGSGNYVNCGIATNTGEFVGLSQMVVVMPSGTTGVTQPINFPNPTAFFNSWAAYASTYQQPGFGRSKDGVVYARGLWNGGTIAASMSELPRNWRPRYQALFATVSNAAIARIDIGAALVNNGGLSGAVLPASGSNLWYSLDGVSWPADLQAVN